MKREINKLERLGRVNLGALPPSPAASSVATSRFVHTEDPRGSSSGGGGGGGGGIASPLLELARDYHEEPEVYASPDGLFQFSVKRIKKLKFQDAEGVDAVFNLNLVRG